MAQWFLFLPQIRLAVPDIVERARHAEASGFDGVAFIDHLTAPLADHQPLWEAMTIAAWVAAKTDRLRIGHLVLCNAFRHPAVLAKQAVTLAEASGGRFELGLGSGSVPAELTRFGITADDAKARRAALSDTLDALRGYWSPDGEPALSPPPSAPIPLVIGGSGATTMRLVREHADWWNLPVDQLGRLDELRPLAGRARVSIQLMVGFVGRGADAEAVTATSTRRFGYLGDGLVSGDARTLRAHFGALEQRGVERFYVWFSDFATPATLAEFGDTVIAAAR